MNIYERRRKALQHLLDYWEQSVGMIKAVEYVANQDIYMKAIRWRAAIHKAIRENETNYHHWKERQRKQGEPPWSR